MIPLILEKQDELTDICKRFKVRSLELFGSGTSGEFNPAASDLDFLVEFYNLDLATYADHYFGLLEELENLFTRRVELVVASSIKNPYFLENIQKSRTLLYAA